MHRTPNARRALSIIVAACCVAASCGSDSSEGDDTVPAVAESEAGRSELPNACPAEGCAIVIADATASDGEIALTLDANFTPDFERNHMHIFWDSQQAGAVSSDFQERGFAEQGKWHPTDEYPEYVTQADASVASEFRGDSTTICVTAADTDHAVIDPSITECRDVADLLS